MSGSKSASGANEGKGSDGLHHDGGLKREEQLLLNISNTIDNSDVVGCGVKSVNNLNLFLRRSQAAKERKELCCWAARGILKMIQT